MIDLSACVSPWFPSAIIDAERARNASTLKAIWSGSESVATSLVSKGFMNWPESAASLMLTPPPASATGRPSPVGSIQIPWALSP